MNRGRNNRPAVLQSANINPEMLSSEDFMVAPVTGTSVSTYWVSGDNKNLRDSTESKFHFMFKFEGVDPYNIIIRTTYNRPYTYIEKNDGTNNFVYKWYKEASLFAVSSGNNCYIASDEHRKYKTAWVDGGTNPIDPAYDNRPGNYHGQSGVIWNSVALLPNSDNSGYVFMATRAVDANGAIGNTIYYLKQKDNCNNLNFASGNSTDNLSIEGLYPIKKVTFKVATPFYKVSPTTDHIISVEDQVSQYTVDYDPIETQYLPDGLKRKYIEFNGKFYKDAACTQEITKFSDAVEDPTEGYQVYVGYDVSPSAPKFLSPSASYTTATWYELTDAGSTQEYGRKIKWNAGSPGAYKNNGANGEYVKESEFALVGDPYEVKVLYRKGTEDAGSNSYVTLSTHDSWDMPYDATAGSFLLREYKGTGHWYWDAGHASADVTYGADPTPSVGKDAQTIVFNLSGLSGSKYYKITVGGTDASQIASVAPRAGYVYPETGTTATVEVFLAENTSGSAKTMTVTIQEYTDNEGTSASGSSSVITITQGTTSSSFTPSAVGYSTTNSTRVKVLDLPKLTYTYNIVDKSGRIAVKASAEQTIFSTLSLASIPSIIVSPFLLGETVTFYDDNYVDGSGRGSLTSSITETPNVADDIYVTYTTTNLVNKPIKLSEDQEFNVVLNGQYLWYDSSDGSIKTNSTPSTGDLKLSKYLWKLRNHDPYAMLIDNLGAREHLSVTGDESVTMYNDAGTPGTETRQKGAWVALESIDNEGVLSFTKRRSSESEGEGLYAQRFVAKASTNTGVYEVMVATGAGTDASTNYYNIGRPIENTVKIYDNAHYAHGSDILKFQLEQTIGYVYHLIDKAKHELLTQTSQNPDLAMPADYQSPLVSKYHFYDPANITETSKATGNEYEPKPSATELTSLASLNATYDTPVSSNEATWSAAGEGRKLEATSYDNMTEKAKQLGETGHYYFKVSGVSVAYHDVNVTKPFYNHIYVTYDANDIVKFGNTSQYTLKFLEPLADGYYLEDGNDKLTTTKLQAVYPYTNGDGNLNIYSQEMKDEQMAGGANTRPRWVWYFNSTNNDPYHVRIHSRSTISYSGVSHPTYLQTYAVHFNQDTEKPKQERIVTGGGLPGVASATPTEYMILGAQGAYKLMTTYPVVADLDGDGNTTGSGENERRKVTSFEQYWKTYNMAKLHVLRIAASTDDYSTDESTWVVPNEPASYRTTLEARGWHSYTAYANATRWNGYNDKEDGHEKKVVENIEHWYQTFNMGNGTFDIESADIPPVLVLLDLHGWEIMRLPLPTTNYPYGDTELAALRAYDSPMVDKYYFYSNATKASGCHKYRMRLNDKDEERDQIKVDGERYSSTSLGNLPPITATGVKSGSTFNDQYVIYTVKEEYTKSYTYAYNKDTHAETETPSKFLMVQHGRFYKYENRGTEGSSYMTKPIIEHTNPEGGNVYDLILNPDNKSGNDNIVTGEDKHWIGNCLWYVKPNQNIDKEMGIKYATETGGTGEPWTEYETKQYYYENGKAGFDPYNLQIQLLKKNNGTDDLRYLTSHMTSTRLENGVLIGDYDEGSGGTTNITLTAGYNYTGWNPLTPTTSTGYDHTNLTISNQTFMAVSDANGNMQLMPRFDHTKRVDLDGASPWYTTLEDPVDHPKASAEDNASQGPQTTFFVRPQIFEYQIINNNGTESLRYKRAGDYYPDITDHFKSPIAKDFTYYKGFAEPGAAEASTEDAWTAAAGDFKRTAATAGIMNSQKNLLPAAGTYYYRIGKSSFEYKKVTVPEGKGLMDKEITGSFADAGLNGDDCNVYVRYDYDADADRQGDKILEGKWFTIKLDNKDVKCGDSDEINTSDGTGVSLLEGTSKPDPVDEDDKTWQWKFLVAPIDPSSELHESPDPYDVQLFNRSANYTDNPTTEPSPMAVGIKVNSKDRFALLSHTSGGYALAVAGLGTYTYNFLNGADMSTSVAATTATETSFTQKAGIFDGVKSQLLVNDDVTHNFVYNVVNNANKFAVSATQDEGAADAHSFQPYLPEAAQTPLLRMKDYKYYGSATVSSGTYTVVPNTKLFTLHGLYDDKVYVRYDAYHVDSTEFKIPNKKAVVAGKVARDPSSVDVSMNIEGGLPYNIIWENDNMMSTETDETTTIYDGSSQSLSGLKKNVWYIEGNDPYALKIRHKESSNYVNGTATLVATAADAKEFMLLKKSGYDYGILQETAGTNKLSGYGQTMVSGDPTKFIIFGLSVHDLIYHLIIAKTCELSKKSTAISDQYVDIPYSDKNPTPHDPDYSPSTGNLRVYGSTQRDLTSKNSEEGIPGEKYQLGETVTWGGEGHTYSHHAGAVSIGDDLVVPNVFNRPNCTFEFYIAGIYDGTTGDELTDLEAKYKGLKRDKLMSDADLIDETVVVNIVYKFNETLATNAGMDFVRSTDQNLWYTFETQEASVPQLARYTKTQGLTVAAGRETHYTNDYLFTPLGDVYGFKMYNRYVLKNGNETKNKDESKVMTTTSLGAGQELDIVAPVAGGYEVYELLTGDNDGYFRVHPVVDIDDGDPETSYNPVYVNIADNKLKLSTTPRDWTYGLDVAMLQPYYLGAGNVGGLTTTPKAGREKSGKTLYEEALAKAEFKITDLQAVVYNDDNIVDFATGYYRLHSQPGISGISPVRYASGYLHDIETTAESGGIPMHFYSKSGVNGTFNGDLNPLKSGYTQTNATRGDIPVPSTETDPSTIFHITGSTLEKNKTISDVTLSTQRLNVIENKMGTGTATEFKMMDIGGGIVILYKDVDATRKYLTFDQTSYKYDLKYQDSGFQIDQLKWCVEPANTMGLDITTNNGGDGYYYSTLYMPFDVLLPADAGGKTYNAYVCKKWYNDGVNPVPVPAVSTYDEGKFVPAGTPVIIRTNDDSESVTLSLPNNAPSSPLASNIFSGTYLEQLLAVDAAHDVYTLGLPLKSSVSKDVDYSTTGDITAPLPTFANNGVGFYINATSNKEADPLQSLWTRNNRYVLHNKIYYRAGATPGASAPQQKAPQFVPVIFGDEEEQEMNPDGTMEVVGDGCIYDLMGRKVATREQVEDGSWKQRVATGIYILNGKKFQKK